MRFVLALDGTFYMVPKTYNKMSSQKVFKKIVVIFNFRIISLIYLTYFPNKT